MITLEGSCAGRPDVMEAEQQALKVCESCPDLAKCRAWVLSVDPELDPAGVCGGLTEDERGEIRGRRIPKTCTWCHVTKTRADFNRDPLAHTGLRTNCKDCGRQRSKDNRAKTRERAKANA